MRNRFDQLSKRIGMAALDDSGKTGVHDEISPETLYADIRHEPDPARDAERTRRGLLGRLASTLCLIEIFGHAPGGEEFRACVAKHFAFWQERARKHRQAAEKTKKQGQKVALLVKPFLWIIAAGRPVSLLKRLNPDRRRGWPEGVFFFGGDLFRVGLVVASELPRDRSTLLVRLMAAGPLLPQATKELAALPAGAHERAVAEQILLDFQHVLDQQPRKSHEEQEFIMTVLSTWEDARQEGRKEGQAEGTARAVMTLLRVRGIEVPDEVRQRILSEKDPNRLERWHERAILASSAAEVINEPS